MNREMSEQVIVEVLGLEEHLTVRSRSGAARWDLWFALSRNLAGTEWDKAFQRSAESSASDLCARLESFPFTPTRGWIVARGVPEGCHVSEIEAFVRQFASTVNEMVNNKAADLAGTTELRGGRRRFGDDAGSLWRSVMFGARPARSEG